MPTRRPRILYAEDEISNRELMSIKLERAGYDCHCARDGLRAWEAFQAETFDLVILDHYMPQLDGLDVARRIREIAPQMPIIGITSNDALRRQLLDAGFNAVLIKPLRGSDVTDLIHQLLNP